MASTSKHSTRTREAGAAPAAVRAAWPNRPCEDGEEGRAAGASPGTHADAAGTAAAIVAETINCKTISNTQGSGYFGGGASGKAASTSLRVRAQ